MQDPIAMIEDTKRIQQSVNHEAELQGTPRESLAPIPIVNHVEVSEFNVEL